MTPPNCIRCESTAMEHGFQVDDVQRGVYRQSQWAPGPPETDDATFLGMKMSEDWLLKIEEEELKAIYTWRCPKCGYLEQYAPD